MRRAVLGLGAAAAATWAAARIVPLVRAREEVDPQYLHPIPLPPSVPVNAVTVGLLGRLPQGEPKPQEGVTTTRRQAPGAQVSVPVDVYVPHDHAAGSPALVWIHGGGLVMGSSAGYAEYCARIARELGIVVVSVEYRLAPAHPAPAAVDDCYAALRWLHDEAEALGIDPHRIAVGGDSAGGGLAAATVQLAHDHGPVKAAFQLLVYPMLDDRTCLRDRDSVRFVWTPKANYHGWRAYLGQQPGLADVPPYSVPARRTDLAGLPPAWIGVGSLDLFHDEDIDYADRLEAAGVPVELVVVPGAFHGFYVFAPDAPGSRAFVDAHVNALRRNGYLPPVVAMPLTRYFWPKRKARNIGIRETIDIANIAPQFDPDVESRNDRSATGTVYMSGLVR